MSSSSSSSNKNNSKNSKEFVLKDSPPELVSLVGVRPQGRKYDRNYADQPGAVRIEDVVTGMKYASLAITDDEEDTLKKIGRSNPWHVEALKMITGGSEEEAHRPLSHILRTHAGLECDEIIDVSGVAKNGQMLDTQGYIAHNDTTIVLAYRCTTSIKDWLTNFSTTSSAWEPDEDAEQGHSGYCSGLEGLCCYDGEYRPRVHTGFYSNFLSTLPAIQEKILPLLVGTGQPPRKLYVVGHSLGAGIATMAACYFLLHLDWETSPHTMVALTAGGPRAVQQSMKNYVVERMNVLRPLDRAVFCRIVRDRDVVPSLPPEMLGFRHLDKLVYITDGGELIINPKLKDADRVIDEKEMQKLAEDNPDIATELGDGDDDGNGSDDDSDSDDDDDDDEEIDSSAAQPQERQKKSKYEKMVSKIPAPFRDHMPDSYLVPLIRLFENETGLRQSGCLGDDDDDDSYDDDDEEGEEEDTNVAIAPSVIVKGGAGAGGDDESDGASTKSETSSEGSSSSSSSPLEDAASSPSSKMTAVKSKFKRVFSFKSKKGKKSSPAVHS
mmetsp:Transcript_30412/g.90750  ORF Transcript_30412/g.90750 Transcript_30412/m.90750 type:complete len:552 (-) Transcript_30412:194-1849(-)